MKYLLIKQWNSCAFIYAVLMMLMSLGINAQPLVQKTDTRTRDIIKFSYRTFHFNGASIQFVANFPTARLNHVEQKNDSCFTAIIEAENYPINSSPWYAFKAVSTKKQTIYVTLNYKQASHRYHPKVSKDGKKWYAMDTNHVKVFYDSALIDGTSEKRNKWNKAELKIELSTDTTWIAAQPITSTADVQSFVNQLCVTNKGVDRISVGQSILGRELPAFRIGKEKKSKPLILFISRQHPPEVTGYFAMQHFLRSYIKSDWHKKHFTTYVIPLMNPDGVDLGHWRHNAGGIDLNRDWKNQHQVETKQVVSFIKEKIDRLSSNLVAMIDFHSTYFDVFYINLEDSLSHIPRLVIQTLEQTRNSLGVDKLNIKPTKIQNAGVSKNFFYHHFQAESFVYEVGDDTSLELIKKKGEAVAKSFMNAIKKLSL